MERRRLINASLGDPLYPFTTLANHAFRASKANLNNYLITNIYDPTASTIKDIVDPICNYFTARGIYDKDSWSGLGRSDLLLTGGGVTEGFELIIRLLAEDIKRHNTKNKQPIQPVILMPVPTYGMFYKTVLNWDIEIVTVERDLKNGGRLDLQKLDEALHAIRKDGKRVVAFYDSNPHNPLGLIREEEETKAITRVLLKHSYIYREEDKKSKNPKRVSWEGPASRIKIIDDMVYDGLEYGDQKPFSFAQIPRVFDHTFVLAGPSKSGLVNTRAGVIIGNSRHIQDMRKIQSTVSYFPPQLSLHTLQCYFNREARFVEMRRAHLEKSVNAYKFLGKLMKVLVNGLDAVPEASEADVKRMTNLLVKHKKMKRCDALTRLKSGIKGVQIITTPQAGFFHLLDFSALMGREISNDHIPYKRYSGTTEVDSERYITHMFHSAGVFFASGTWAGLEEDRMIVRASFATSPQEIIDLTDRIRTTVKEVKPRRQKGISIPVQVISL